MRKRWQAKLREVKAELKRRMHEPIPTVGKYVRAVVLGHVRYYGVPMNGPAITAFRSAVGRVWWRVLRRRSQGNHLPWRRMQPLIAAWLPPARICHPYPLVQLGRHHPRWEPDAVMPLVRICGGGVQQWTSLLRLFRPMAHRSWRSDTVQYIDRIFSPTSNVQQQETSNNAEILVKAIHAVDLIRTCYCPIVMSNKRSAQGVENQK